MPRNVNADIDGTLFGDAKKNKARAVKRSDGSAGLSKASSIGDFYSGGGSAGKRAQGPRTVKLVTKNEVRNLTIRRKSMGPSACVIGFSDYVRMRTNAVPLAQQPEALDAAARRRRAEELAEMSETRKTEFEQIDMQRPEDVQNDLDIEAQMREESVLAKATSMLEDDEDEVRQLKSTILQAQCQAVRDAQLREKEEIAEALRAEEERLDAMMEEARVRKIAEAEAKATMLKDSYVAGRRELEAQIEDRRMTRLLEEELREVEQQQLLKDIEAMKVAEEEKAAEKAVHAKAMQVEIARANDLALEMRAAKIRADKEEDERLAQYMADKAAAEDAEERRKAAEKAAADAAFRKVLQRQERAMDTSEKREELAARRAHEEKERLMRDKEAREARERREAAVELNRARRAQIEEQHRQRALMSMAERENFERNLEAQLELIETEREAKEKAQTRRITNRDEILAQVKLKEQAIQRERAEFFAEGVKIDEEARARRARLDQIKQRKLDELVTTGLDEGYLHTVKRQINKSPIKTFS